MAGKISKVKLPARGKLKLQAGENIAFLSGEVPRLILISGSDACDIYEGQCLPVEANSPYLQNPHNFEVSVVLGYGMIESPNYASSTVEGPRFYEKTFSAMGLAATVTSHATLRAGYGWITKEGKAEIQIASSSAASRTRITILNDASAAFISAKPAGFMDVAAAFYDQKGAVNQNVVAVAGYFADTDIAAWIAAVGYTGRISQFYLERVENPQRLTIDAKTAVFMSRDPAVSNIAAATARDIGRNSEEFT